MALSDWLMIGAVLFGPLLGIWVTRWIDSSKELRERRWELFATLRRTRGLEASPESVAAVNMVPVLFKDCQGVLTDWGKLMDAANDPAWNSTDGTAVEGVRKRYGDSRQNMIASVATAVGAALPTKEEHRLGYAPMLWENEYRENYEMRHLMLEVLRGGRALKLQTHVVDYTAAVPDQAPRDNAAGALPAMPQRQAD